ncbi:MAG: divergent polysaccharide deacetylase family protein [Rhodospirillales bacterium]
MLALIGIGVGYGVGYLFKETAPAKTESAIPAPAAGPPLLPENATQAPGTSVRPYEEALPANVIENGSELPPEGREITVTRREDAREKAREQAREQAREKAREKAPAPADSKPAAKTADRAGPPPKSAAGAEVAARPAAPPATTEPPPASTPQAPPAVVQRDTGDLPAWRRHAVQVALAEGRPKIAIVIDDLGIDKPRTARTIRLRGPLTLSFLTYASGLGEQTRAARAAGHELLMHIPMEPGSPDVDPGPNVLLTGVPRDELLASLRWNLDQFQGYVGVNNHMGSRFTADLPGMVVVMEEMRKRELLFLDSITAGRSVGRQAARRVGVPFAVRNVFLDDKDDVRGISQRLAEVERLAKKTGVAVAIGHPRESTLRALGPWLDGIETKGFQLVPVSAVIRIRARRG